MDEKQTSQNEPNDNRNEVRSLQPHIQEFIRHSQDLERIMKNGNAIEITQTRSNLKIFYATLTPEQQEDIHSKRSDGAAH